MMFDNNSFNDYTNEDSEDITGNKRLYYDSENASDNLSQEELEELGFDSFDGFDTNEVYRWDEKEIYIFVDILENMYRELYERMRQCRCDQYSLGYLDFEIAFMTAAIDTYKFWGRGYINFFLKINFTRLGMSLKDFVLSTMEHFLRLYGEDINNSSLYNVMHCLTYAIQKMKRFI